MEAVVERRWLQRPGEVDPDLAKDLAQRFGLRPVTAELLVRRGLTTPAELEEFLSSRLASLPDPALMKGMESAVRRLQAAVTNGERILVHGDYDVDGISGAAMLTEVLTAFGGKVEYFLPLRLRHGYGLAEEAVRQASDSGVGVILSVDCGISAHAEAQLAADLGIDLIITDHHHPPPSLPVARAILNPLQEGCRFPFKPLSGVGVAFFLLVALRRALREAGHFGQRPEFDLRQVLDLVALGTIADLVPLHGVNRTLAKQGLASLNGSTRPGIVSLKQVSEVNEVNCGAVGFRLAPRLNAAGRLEDASLGVQLLLGREPAACREIAGLLDGWNRERQELEKGTLEDAIRELQDAPEDLRSIVLGRDGWHQGVIGIVASRLVERFYRPVVLVAFQDDEGKGSARSISGFHLFEGLAACGERLTAFGGHAAAAGLSVAREDFKAFAELFEAQVAEKVAPEDRVPRIIYDDELSLPEIDFAWARELEGLVPFGIGNPEPVFLVRQVEAVQIAFIGREREHLRFTAVQGEVSAPCVAFGMAGRRELLAGVVDLLCTVGINRWNGRESVQLQVKELRPALA